MLYLKNPNDLLYKYKNLCETNDPYSFNEKIDEKYLNIHEIENRVKLGLDIIGRDEIYKVKKLNEEFPEYLLKNLTRYKDWFAN